MSMTDSEFERACYMARMAGAARVLARSVLNDPTFALGVRRQAELIMEMDAELDRRFEAAVAAARGDSMVTS
jgi:DnaJ-domain-containing protein 1